MYKFGRDNSQSLQFFYDNTQFNLAFGLGTTLGTLPYPNNDRLFLTTASGALGIPIADIQAVTPNAYGQRSLTDRIGSYNGRRAENSSQPNETFKLQYSNSLNATTFLTAKFYHVNAVTIIDNPYQANQPIQDEVTALQGGQRVGFALDGTKQIGSKHLIGFGGKYEFLSPVFDDPSGTDALFAFGYSGQSAEIADFLPAANCPYGPGACGYLISQGFVGVSRGQALNLGQAGCPATGFGTNNCGALPAAVQLPYQDNTELTHPQNFAFYIKDTFSATDRLKIDVGLRMDGANWHLPACDITTCLPTSYATGPGGNTYQFNYAKDSMTPRVWQPRASFSYQISRNDAVRGSYGRSVQFSPIANIDASSPRHSFDAFNRVPSRDPLTGLPATFCGTSVFLNPGDPQFSNRTCANYGEQLYWENQFSNGVPITPLLPTTFNNYDLSFSHLFPHQLGVKLTPFYSKAYNETASTAVQLVKNGVPLVNASTGLPVFGPSINSNLGFNQTTGVEFLLTKEAAYGLSGSLSLTYQNEFSNVVPTTAGEDFFPTIPPESLLLGNKYRVGFLSPFVGTLALQERTRSGWRINPVIYYNHGYPIGAGLLTATSVNGAPYNLPNTNVTNSSQLGGSNGAPQYVDPRNPGSVFQPNVAAARGTPETASAGGVLSSARFAPVQLTVEYTSPRNPRATMGAVVFNLFNQLYGLPAYNPRYTPVATGIAGPYSGYTSTVFNPLTYGNRNYTSIRGNQAYLLAPNNLGRTVQFYYQRSL